MKLKLLLAPILALFFLLVVRLVHLQIVEGTTYRRMADNNRFFNQFIPAERGVIFDRYQQPLVKNKKIYFLTKDDGLYSAKEPISTEQALQLMAQDPKQVVYELRRYYLYPQELAHALGYTAPVMTEDLVANSQLQANDWLGKMGLEKQFDQVLRGQDGAQLYEVNTWGEKQRLFSEKQPVAGNNLSTSIDPYLSKIAFNAFGEMMGAAVVLDVDTGQVLALVSHPAFNANDLTSTLIDPQLEQQRQLNLHNYFQDERKVFFNRAVSGMYPPGSVFKLVTAIAGLQKQAFDEHKTVLDEGILKVGDYSYANWLYTQNGGTDGEISLVRAIARSNDIYFYKAAEWTGPTSLAAQAREFGFGKSTGIELPAEAAGFVPDPTWKEETQGERWFLGNTYHFGIGQGDMLATPLQNAQLVQSLIKGGELCPPRFLTEPVMANSFNTNQQLANNCQSLGLTEENVNLVLQGMIGACQPGGTASIMFGFNQNFTPLDQVENAIVLINQGAVACKTGTAEVGGENALGRRNTHGWFVAGTSVDTSQMIEIIKTRAEEAQVSEQGNIQGLTAEELRQWAEHLEKFGFPKKIVLVALVESDDALPYKEGSIHAAPIIKAMLAWMK